MMSNVQSCPCKTASSREEAMVVIERDAKGTPTIWCDPCIAPLVRALNASGIPTSASCCGHGHRPATIMLADGRELVIAPDHAVAEQIGTLFPIDINGERRP